MKSPIPLFALILAGIAVIALTRPSAESAAVATASSGGAVVAEHALAAAANPITEEEVLAAQAAWGEAVVAIGAAKSAGKNFIEVAEAGLDELYAYDDLPVLFKPTLAAQDQFRGTEAEALSYFVRGVIDEDKGFALQPWTTVRFENTGIVLTGPMAVAMGNYYFTKPSGDEVKVEYSFGYIRGEDGGLKIALHHSSLPYQPES
ncbi:MAG: phosphoribosyl-AMP cyclohydrolase [Pseudomonadota bacterium]